jgi:hypothetical protein
MEEVFGNGQGGNIAAADQERLDAIHRKLGLIVDGLGDEDLVKDDEKGISHHEKSEGVWRTFCLFLLSTALNY